MISSHRSLDVAPEPVVDEVGEVEAGVLPQPAALVAYEGDAGGDHLQGRGGGENLKNNNFVRYLKYTTSTLNIE